MARVYLFMVMVFSGLPGLLYSQVFKDSTLRIDYLLGGTSDTAEVFIQHMKKEPHYGGSLINLIDDNDYGTYRYRLFDCQSRKLIFSRGFCPLFQEWQTTEEAAKMKKSFYQVAILPFPSVKVNFTIDRKAEDGHYQQLISLDIDPSDYFIVNEDTVPFDFEEVVKNGEPASKVDLVFLPEGYTQQEMSKFMDDVARMTDILFAAEPFASRKSDFNVYAVKVSSVQSGTDIPGERIYRNTVFSSTFYTFDISRYLTTTDMKSIHDAASRVPYDHIFILVNSERYGGGGFYNFLTVSTTDNNLTPQVLIHEFGHAFAGLADEYYTSDVAYKEYYNLKVEPWEPNITTLVKFESKWKDMIGKKTPVPTPRGEKFKNTLGVFEGGGYVTKGIYSPMMDCRMKSNQAEGFCPVCKKAIETTIDRYCR
ncbi:MAG: M64 family metallopeptidase [Mangrovibacterium sp.]